MAVVLPTHEELTHQWTQLIGRKVTVKDGPAPGASYALATYIADDGHVAALGLFDAAVAASLGAALILIPAGVARDAAKEQDLPESLSGSFQEVANVTSSLFARLGVHVKLRDVAYGPTTPPADVAAVLAAPKQRLNMTVTVDGYDPGAGAFLLA